MAKKNITASFRLFSFITVLASTLLSKILYIVYLAAVADVTVSNFWAMTARYSSQLFNLFSVACTVCITVYAHSYFGKRTTTASSLVSFACLAIGKIAMFVYNVIANEMTTAKLISGALSYLTEMLFDCLIIIIAVVLSITFAKKRDLSKKEESVLRYSPLKADVISVIIYFSLLIADLTAMNVIPFFVKYGTPTVIEIKNIVADYLYYLISMVVAILLSILINTLLTKVTGKLQLKKYYQLKA